MAHDSKDPFVFISYSHTDKKFAASFAQRLQNKGIRYFRDEDSILWGEQIPERIHTALQNATHLVILISPGSEHSQWVAYEMGFASCRGVILIPYLLHSEMKLPGFIADRKCIRGPSEEKRFIEKLLSYEPSNEIDLTSSHSKSEKIIPKLSIKDASEIRVSCGSEFVEVEIGMRTFKENEILNDEDITDAVKEFWEVAFQLILVLSGRKQEELTLGRKRVNTNNRDFVTVSQNALPFTPKYKEWGTFYGEIPLGEGWMRSLEEGFVDFYFIPYQEDDQHSYQEVCQNAEVESRIAKLEISLKKIIERIVCISLGKKITVIWNPVKLARAITTGGSDAYWFTGLISES